MSQHSLISEFALDPPMIMWKEFWSLLICTNNYVETFQWNPIMVTNEETKCAVSRCISCNIVESSKEYRDIGDHQYYSLSDIIISTNFGFISSKKN